MNCNSDFLSLGFPFFLQVNFTIYNFLLVFARHVYDLIKRATVSHQIPNPFSSSLKDNCPFIYDVAVYLSQLIECEFGIHMSEAEINLVAIHIGYSIDDMNNDKKIKCIIYNSVYQNNERVIVHKILNKFRGMLNIIEVKNDFSQLLKECSAQPDVLFISTVSNVPIRENLCTISPIVSEKDIDKVYNCIESLRKLDERFSLRELIKKYTDSDLFYTSINYSNRDDLIYYLANDLFNKNIVSETFATSVIERENKSSTCFFNKFSIPHALDLNAKKTAISVVISERSINWGNSEIYVVFLIAISNKDMNLFSKMYDGLISSILEDRIFERLSKAKDYEGFLNCF
nr:PTS sugar transporter subunit IIA [Breznakia blatticola]